MVDFLIPSSVFQMLRFCLTCPHYVPFGAVRAYYPEPSILQWVHYWVVDMRRFSNLETKCHIMLLEVVLSCHLDFLELSQMWSGLPFDYLEEGCPLFHFVWWSSSSFLFSFGRVLIICSGVVLVAVFWIGEEYPCRWLRLTKRNWLQQHNLFRVRLIHRTWYLPVFLH